MLFYLFAEMVESMKAVAAQDVELSVEERNLLSVAYKNVIGARRASWRIISSLEQKEEQKKEKEGGKVEEGDEKLGMIRTYRQQVSRRNVSKAFSTCASILDLLFKSLCCFKWQPSQMICIISWPG